MAAIIATSIKERLMHDGETAMSMGQLNMASDGQSVFVLYRGATPAGWGERGTVGKYDLEGNKDYGFNLELEKTTLGDTAYRMSYCNSRLYVSGVSNNTSQGTFVFTSDGKYEGKLDLPVGVQVESICKIDGQLVVFGTVTGNTAKRAIWLNSSNEIDKEVFFQYNAAASPLEVSYIGNNVILARAGNGGKVYTYKADTLESNGDINLLDPTGSVVYGLTWADDRLVTITSRSNGAWWDAYELTEGVPTSGGPSGTTEPPITDLDKLKIAIVTKDLTAKVQDIYDKYIQAGCNPVLYVETDNVDESTLVAAEIDAIHMTRNVGAQQLVVKDMNTNHGTFVISDIPHGTVTETTFTSGLLQHHFGIGEVHVHGFMGVPNSLSSHDSGFMGVPTDPTLIRTHEDCYPITITPISLPTDYIELADHPTELRHMIVYSTQRGYMSLGIGYASIMSPFVFYKIRDIISDYVNKRKLERTKLLFMCTDTSSLLDYYTEFLKTLEIDYRVLTETDSEVIASLATDSYNALFFNSNEQAKTPAFAQEIEKLKLRGGHTVVGHTRDAVQNLNGVWETRTDTIIANYYSVNDYIFRGSDNNATSYDKVLNVANPSHWLVIGLPFTNTNEFSTFPVSNGAYFITATDGSPTNWQTIMGVDVNGNEKSFIGYNQEDRIIHLGFAWNVDLTDNAKEIVRRALTWDTTGGGNLEVSEYKLAEITTISSDGSAVGATLRSYFAETGALISEHQILEAVTIKDIAAFYYTDAMTQKVSPPNGLEVNFNGNEELSCLGSTVPSNQNTFTTIQVPITELPDTGEIVFEADIKWPDVTQQDDYGLTATNLEIGLTSYSENNTTAASHNNTGGRPLAPRDGSIPDVDKPCYLALDVAAPPSGVSYCKLQYASKSNTQVRSTNFSGPTIDAGADRITPIKVKFSKNARQTDGIDVTVTINGGSEYTKLIRSEWDFSASRNCFLSLRIRNRRDDISTNDPLKLTNIVWPTQEPIVSTLTTDYVDNGVRGNTPVAGEYEATEVSFNQIQAHAQRGIYGGVTVRTLCNPPTESQPFNMKGTIVYPTESDAAYGQSACAMYIGIVSTPKGELPNIITGAAYYGLPIADQNDNTNASAVGAMFFKPPDGSQGEYLGYLRQSTLNSWVNDTRIAAGELETPVDITITPVDSFNVTLSVVINGVTATANLNAATDPFTFGDENTDCHLFIHMHNVGSPTPWALKDITWPLGVYTGEDPNAVTYSPTDFNEHYITYDKLTEVREVIREPNKLEIYSELPNGIHRGGALASLDLVETTPEHIEIDFIHDYISSSGTKLRIFLVQVPVGQSLYLSETNWFYGAPADTSPNNTYQDVYGIQLEDGTNQTRIVRKGSDSTTYSKDTIADSLIPYDGPRPTTKYNLLFVKEADGYKVKLTGEETVVVEETVPYIESTNPDKKLMIVVNVIKKDYPGSHILHNLKVSLGVGAGETGLKVPINKPYYITAHNKDFTLMGAKSYNELTLVDTITLNDEILGGAGNSVGKAVGNVVNLDNKNIRAKLNVYNRTTGELYSRADSDLSGYEINVPTGGIWYAVAVDGSNRIDYQTFHQGTHPDHTYIIEGSSDSISVIHGAAVPINSLVPINSNDAWYYDPDGYVFLKSGTVSMNTGTYPDAFSSNGEIGLSEAKFFEGIPLYLRIK